MTDATGKVKEICLAFFEHYTTFGKTDEESFDAWINTPQAKSLIGELGGGMRWVRASEIDIDYTREYIAKWKDEFVNNGRFNKLYEYFKFSQVSYGVVKEDFDNLYILVKSESPSIEQGEPKELEFARWIEDNCEVIREEKITLYRYYDRLDGIGNYTLEDIYLLYTS